MSRLKPLRPFRTAWKHEPIDPQTPRAMAAYLARGRLPEGTASLPTTCGTCGRTWDDARITMYTPAPAARCPFEWWHRRPK